MQLSGKKLTTAILAGLMGATMFGGSVFAEVTDQEFNEVRQGVNSNTQRISQLESAQSATKDYSKDIDANTTAIANEVTARTDADTKLDTRITNVKEYLENQTAANYVSKTDAAVQDGAVAKAGNTIGENVTNLDGALAKETAARIGADAAQDTAIKQVNDNLVSSVNTINQNIGTITDQLNNNDLAEQQARAAADKAEADARDAADQTLQKNIDAEVTARTDADTKLDTRITSVKEYLENQTAANYVSKTDAAVQDGAVAKAGNTIGQNVTNLDGALAKETAARIGADKAQDKVIEQVNKNVADGFTALNQADAKEATARDAADKTLQKNIDAETTARQTDVANLQKNITDSLIKQGKINETLTTTATNLEKHLSDTDGRVDKANAEIHTNAGNIAQNKKDISDIQKTLNDANALASADATNAAKKAANDATTAADNANKVADGLKDRVDRISYNQDVTSESDLIKKDQSIGQNLTNVDTALHKEIAARIGADKAQDKVIEQVNKNVADGFDTINKNVAAGFTALNQADANEATERKAADSQLNKTMTKGFATIQGQQDAQDAKIDKNHTDIQTNAGNIKNNGDAIKANSDRLDNHEGRIAGNETNIATNARNISKEISDRQDADTSLQKNIDKEASDRATADQNLQTQINNNSTSINDLYGRYSSLKTDINKVGARSAALAGLHPLDFDPANKLNFAVASGSFKGENSVALGAFYRPNENIMFSAASTMGDSDNAYTFGLSFKIGPSSAKTKTTSPDAEELYKVVGELQDQLAAQQKEIEQLKANKAK